jgi:hypothetical protein
MNKNNRNNFKAVLIISVLILITKSVALLPWFSFTIPLFVFGIWLSFSDWNINSFFAGFITGFLIWFGGNVYFDLTLKDDSLYRIGQMVSVPKIFVIFISGILGGLLSGLSVYAGKSFIYVKGIKRSNLE